MRYRISAQRVIWGRYTTAPERAHCFRNSPTTPLPNEPDNQRAKMAVSPTDRNGRNCALTSRETEESVSLHNQNPSVTPVSLGKACCKTAQAKPRAAFTTRHYAHAAISAVKQTTFVRATPQ
ncbi:hypothetical protein CDAR_180321 [Caerostris darwini]|uniref:Uncharacterized protein n=1 Tax=Caerostris darwini TaxID=1538125 RepID=A0AAV4NP02_9ARAC|nr:hypothetical protein CDAR_180321 [Caerostris darwini]